MLDRRGMTLFDALQAFFQEHQYCGDLDGGVAGDRVDDVYVRGGDQPRRGSGLIIVAQQRADVLVRVAAFG